MGIELARSIVLAEDCTLFLGVYHHRKVSVDRACVTESKTQYWLLALAYLIAVRNPGPCFWPISLSTSQPTRNFTPRIWIGSSRAPGENGDRLIDRPPFLQSVIYPSWQQGIRPFLDSDMSEFRQSTMAAQLPRA